MIIEKDRLEISAFTQTCKDETPLSVGEGFSRQHPLYHHLISTPVPGTGRELPQEEPRPGNVPCYWIPEDHERVVPRIPALCARVGHIRDRCPVLLLQA